MKSPSIQSGPIFRFATPDDIKVTPAKRRKNNASWRERLSKILTPGEAVRRPASLGDRKRAIEESLGRVKSLMAGSGNLPQALAYHEQALEALEDSKALENIADLRARASSGDGEAVALLSEIQRRSVSEMVMPNATWANFFERVTLGDEDQFACETRVGTETAVRVIGEDGKPFLQSPSNNFSLNVIPIMDLHTDIFEYPLRDLQNGSAARDQALSSIDLGRDLAAKLDGMAAAQINITSPDTILTATFTTTGDLAKRSYVSHSYVNDANLPAGNIIVLTDNTGTSQPRSAIFRAILEYVGSWGTGGLTSGDLRVEAIHLPSKVASLITSEIDFTSADGDYANSIQAQGFARIRFAGHDFTIVADSTLDPTSPYAYVKFNQPVGFLVEKPSLADVIQDETPERRRLNRGQISANQPYGLCLPSHWTHRVLAIKWQD